MTKPKYARIKIEFNKMVILAFIVASLIIASLIKERNKAVIDYQIDQKIDSLKELSNNNDGMSSIKALLLYQEIDSLTKLRNGQ